MESVNICRSINSRTRVQYAGPESEIWKLHYIEPTMYCGEPWIWILPLTVITPVLIYLICQFCSRSYIPISEEECQTICSLPAEQIQFIRNTAYIRPFLRFFSEVTHQCHYLSLSQFAFQHLAWVRSGWSFFF